jgi:hypothetical protein
MKETSVDGMRSKRACFGSRQRKKDFRRSDDGGGAYSPYHIDQNDSE